MADMTDWFHKENVVILPKRPVLRPIANNGDISVISFFRIDPTQPMKKQPTCSHSLTTMLVQPFPHHLKPVVASIQHG